MVEEIWKDIEEFNGLYEVSNFGNVRSIDRYIEINGGSYWKKGRVLKQQLGNCREKTVCLCCAELGYKRKPYLVNRLVAKAFVSNPFDLPMAIHIDCNNLNNNADNLQWATCTENRNKELTKLRIKKALSQAKIGVPLHENFENMLHEARERSKESRRKPVNQLDLNGDLIKTWDRISDAEDAFEVSRGCITMAIKRGNKSSGYMWRYAEK